MLKGNYGILPTKVLITKRNDNTVETDSGIYLYEKNEPHIFPTAKVVLIGKEVKQNLDLNIGDKIAYDKVVGEEILIEKQKFLLISYTAIKYVVYNTNDKQ